MKTNKAALCSDSLDAQLLTDTNMISKSSIREGWLDKWTNYLNLWSRRYIVIDSNGYLCYGNSKSGPFKRLSLSEAQITIIGGDSLRISISTKNDGTLLFRTNCIESRNLWYTSLKQALNDGMQLAMKNMQLASSTDNAIRKSVNESLPSVSDSTSHPVKTASSETQNRTASMDIVQSKLINGVAVDETIQTSLLDSPHSAILNTDGSQNKSSFLCLSENVVAFTQHVEAAFKDIRPMQSALVEEIGKLYSQQLLGDSKLKENVLLLIQRIDFLKSIIDCHLESAHMFVADEIVEKEQLENALQWFARKCFSFECRLRHHEIASSSSTLGKEFKLLPFLAIEDEMMNERFEAATTQEFYDCMESASNDDVEGFEGGEKTRTLTPVSVKDTGKENELLDILAIDGYMHALKGYRKRLPVPREKINMNVWKVVKDFIGKELNRISMPVGLNEPTSFLQRLAEDFQYEYLLKKAVSFTRSVERLAWVAVFVASPYASACGRAYKPFNPLLGETFEHSHRGFRFLSEQVSHHPPITAYHVENAAYSSWGYLLLETRFSKGFLRVTMPGIAHLVFPSSSSSNSIEGEHYTYQRADILVHNVILGNLWIEIDGIITIRNETTGDVAILQFLPVGWMSGTLHQFRAIVLDCSFCCHFYLSGIWSKELYMKQLNPKRNYFFPNKGKIATSVKVASKRNSYMEKTKNVDQSIQTLLARVNWDALEKDSTGEKKLVWRCSPRPVDSDGYYGFGYFTMELNEFSQDYQSRENSILPPTDSRFRPDQRAYEEGNIDLAKNEKNRLEEKQRAAARLRAKQNEEYKPHWFEKRQDTITKKEEWVYEGNYWECKQRGCFETLPEIF